MTRTLLSASVGVPIALVVMSLLFALDVSNVAARRRSVLVRSSAVLLGIVFVGLVIARFAYYT